MENLRRLTRALRPIYLEDLGLVAALEVLARETQQIGKFPVVFRRTGEPRRLSPQTELALYRMAQETLNNVVRHAQATQCHLEIEFVPKVVMLRIEDNGLGFTPPESPAELAPQGHFGLLGLHERAELIGAILDIQSAPGNGAWIGITLKEK
jgi:signal transduction histidine kinase